MQQLKELNEEKLTVVQQYKEQLLLAEQYLNQKTIDIEELKDIVQKLKVENEVYEAKAARLKNKAKQIAEE
jgi:hypothetical protein